MSKPQAILCDLDKTLALIGDRDPYDATDCEQDSVNEPIAAILDAFDDAGYLILLLTGRQACYQEATTQWLAKHHIPYSDLLMREMGDSRPDTVVKAELYQRYIEPSYAVLCVLEDRSRVVKMWRSLGLTCLQVAEGDY